MAGSDRNQPASIPEKRRMRRHVRPEPPKGSERRQADATLTHGAASEREAFQENICQ